MLALCLHGLIKLGNKFVLIIEKQSEQQFVLFDLILYLCIITKQNMLVIYICVCFRGGGVDNLKI